MTDSSDRVLAAIDDRLSECIVCGAPAMVPLYCSETCQTASMSTQVEPLNDVTLVDIGYRRIDPGDGTIRFEPVERLLPKRVAPGVLTGGFLHTCTCGYRDV